MNNTEVIGDLRFSSDELVTMAETARRVLAKTGRASVPSSSAQVYADIIDALRTCISQGGGSLTTAYGLKVGHEGEFYEVLVDLGLLICEVAIE